MEKIQIVKKYCCGTVFAACWEPECYIDKDWLKDLKKYIARGDTVEVIPKNEFNFGKKCTCVSKKITTEMKLPKQ